MENMMNIPPWLCNGMRKIYAKWLVWRRKAVDIWSKNPYPSDVLSNLSDNSFCFDGIACGSMEGFLQSLKRQDEEEQRQLCAMRGKDAQKMTSAEWQENQTIWWKGQAINRQAEDFRRLVRRAYKAMYEQSDSFRTALISTKGKRLLHSRGKRNPRKTILTEQEFCRILTELRDE